MPSRSQLPGNIKRRKFINALVRCGFEIDTSGGDGSHYKATWPKNQKSVTIQSDLRKDVLYYLLKEIEKYSGVTWDDIKNNM
jgi:predicted RNA binding protein YcfA (HicA-like mRNA interferase family)